jgi:hypothetical protein
LILVQLRKTLRIHECNSGRVITPIIALRTLPGLGVMSSGMYEWNQEEDTQEVHP